ncbi:MAG: PD-(D/E)XK nuclease family protein [Treponema sp.]
MPITNYQTIESCISHYAKDARSCFVFPSRITSKLWLHRALSLTGLAALPAEMFLAWDTFKMQCCAPQQVHCTPISQTVRLLFSHHIAALNAKSHPPFFQSLVPPQYAQNGHIFTRWIADILPQLDHLEKHLTTHQVAPDSEMADLLLLKQKYTTFLQKMQLFEPSWIGTKFTPAAERYIIFYPELIEDFSEYAALFDQQPEITIFQTPPFNKDEAVLTVFDTIHAEIRSALLSIEQLLAQGVPSHTIAISAADIQSLMPYLKRECTLRHIPAEFRLGFKLGAQQVGMLFSQLSRCVTEHYSFASMKALLLNTHIPWKHMQTIQAFIHFGIQNNCLVSWRDQDSYKNVWLEAFRYPIAKPNAPLRTEKETAERWFLPFMHYTQQLVHAKTFAEIQQYYFLFSQEYIDNTKLSEEDNAIIARCIASLQELINLETELHEYIPEQPYHFFAEQIAHEIYVPQTAGTAISILPFKVAAGAPFEHHFILNCNQQDTRVLYQKLPFLRKDKKEALGVHEIDASAAFFSAYAQYGHVHFSCAKKLFSGYAIANTLFSKVIAGSPNTPHDSFLQEYRYFCAESDFPQELYPVQKHGFAVFDALKPRRGFSFVTSSFAHQLPALTAALQLHYTNGLFRISQTSLVNFSSCAVKWLLKSILTIQAADTDAELFNPSHTGLICHAVLQKLYQKIHATDTVFISAHRDRYRAWAQELFDTLVYSTTDFQGPLAVPFIQSLKTRVLKSVEAVLSFDEAKLDGYEPLSMEEEFAYASDNICYHGKIDRISYRAADDRAVILDYKTGAVPSASAYTPPVLTDFQIPMYIFLAENTRIQKPIEHAFFLNVSEGKPTYIVNDKNSINQGAARSKTREEFESTMQAFYQAASDFAQKVNAEMLEKPKTVQRQDCEQCAFKMICRTTFLVSKP